MRRLFSAAILLLSASVLTIRAQPKTDLYLDMKMVPVGPFVSSPRAETGTVWSHKLTHSATATAVRIHVSVRKGRPASDWRITFRDLSGNEIETFDGNSEFLATGGIWSRDIPGRGGVVELVSDRNAEGLEIAVDRYAFRATSPPQAGLAPAASLTAIAGAPTDVQPWGRAVARVKFVIDAGQAVCSAFLLTRDLLMTSEHCIGSADIAVTALAELGFDNRDAAPVAVRVAGLEAASSDLDYAVLRLASPVSQFEPVILARVAVQDRQPLVVIHHPSGESKQASVNCSVQGGFVEGTSRSLTDFGHNCVTRGGSAGAPVFDRQTGRVVGVHHMGSLEGDSGPPKRAVHISLILDDLKRRAPGVYSQLRDAGQ